MRNVVIAGPYKTQSGYGHHTREIISNIIEQRKNEWDVKLISLPWGYTPFSYPVPTDWEGREIAPQLQSKPDIWIQVSVPNELQAVGTYNIGVTAGTEGTICPPEWIDSINKLQLLIVPSEFTKQTFIDTAKQTNKQITVEIRVIPEYFSDCYSKDNPLVEISGMDQVTEDFAFLSVGHWLQGHLGEDRKDISGLVYSFAETFKDVKNKPALILKTSGATYSHTDRFDMQQRLADVLQSFGSNIPNIYLLHGDLTDNEMNSLYNHPKVKAFVTFTKAEGFGRPLLEFSTTGKPIIAPHYSGPADFLKKDFICSLPGQLTPIHPSAQNQFLINGARWHTVDRKYAGNMMKDVIKNYKKWLELGKRQRFFAVSNFSSEAVKKHYADLVMHVDDKIKSVPMQVPLNLPKLNLPKLQKI